MASLVCESCDKQYDLNAAVWRCDCGGLLDIDFEARFDIDRIIARKPNMWRYREAIPVFEDNSIVSFEEGFTPLIEIEINGRKILIKQDHLFPTGSYKDRGSSVLVSKINELGVKHVIEDSSGNAGASIAAYCAMAGVKCDIYVPESTSTGKLKQIEAYKASCHRITGSREDTANAALEAAREGYYASHSWNPFFFHGTKTFAYEICEQLNWQTPDSVVVPAGNGTLLLGAYIGFKDLHKAGIIKRLPKLIAVQESSCAPIYRAFYNNNDESSYSSMKPTIAEGIAVAEPIRLKQIIEAVVITRGDIFIVSDDDILNALDEMHGKGFYIEPTAAATIAGLKKYLEHAPSNEFIVSVFTGHGLKSSGK